MCPSMMSLSTLNVARLFCFLAFFKTGNSSFLMSSISFGKSSATPILRFGSMFLTCLKMRPLSLKKDNLAIIGRGLLEDSSA